MILIKNANLYSPYKMGIKDILLSGSSIEYIDENIDVSIPGLTVIDANGEIVHPGFIDGHVHAIGGGGEAGMLSRVPPLAESKIASSGVTTIVGLLGTDGYTRTVRDLVAKVRGYREWGLSAYCLTGSYEVPTITLTGDVADDIIWVDEIIGVKTAISDHRCSFPETRDILTLASKARLASLMSKKCGIVHIHVGADKRGIEQLFEIVNSTILPIKHFYPTHMEGHMEQAKEWLKIGGHIDLTCHSDTDDKAMELLAVNSNLVTISTDSNGSFPKWNSDRSAVIGMGAGSISELDAYVQKMISKGLDRTLAYKTVTENPAKAMAFDKKGKIESGMDADIVIRDGDRIRYVISKGNVLVSEGVVKSSMYE